MKDKVHMRKRNEIDALVYFFSFAIAAILLRTRVIIYSEKVSFMLAWAMALISYYSLLYVGIKLEKRSIRGIREIAWASMGLYSIASVQAMSVHKAHWGWDALNLVCIIVYLIFATRGFIDLFLSTVRLMREQTDDNYLANIEGAIAIFTSVLAIFATIIGVFIQS